ncbi:MAG TPA: cysteine desulfurase NifS [Candidatus Limnocylindrales bacterium]|nr:cysteine desulfurase NifS [Candidatus Limnocylindrales bacterium]
MKIRPIYMDHSATTPVREEVLEAMMPYFMNLYGNPSSVHAFGRDVRRAVDQAREKTAQALGADPSEIYFTAGGTESNNIALRGTAKKRGGKGHIITSGIEHHAVFDVCRDLEDEGFTVTYLPVDNFGLVDVAAVEAALTPGTFMVSIMAANNEVGTIQPIREIGALLKERDVLFHTDAVQVVGQLPINVRELNVDFLSLSAHKFNGPKGIGALYMRKGVSVTPLYRGGGQERKLRPGTENVPGIIGLSTALCLAVAELPQKTNLLLSLRDRLIKGLMQIDEVILNGHPELRLPGNANFSFKHIEGESILLSLDLEGVAASSGSACSSGSLEPSHVLSAIGLDHATAHGSLRFSLGYRSSEEDVDYVLRIMPSIVTKLRNMSPTYKPGQ